MAGIRVEGNTSGNVLEVDSSNNAKVNLPTTIVQTGFAAVAGRVDDGTLTGTARVNRVYATEANALKAAQTALLWDDTFNATAQNTGKYTFTATTQTGSQAGGYLILNTSAITTINTNSGVQTFKTFPMFAKSELRFNCAAMLTQVPQANNLIEFGLFSAVLSTRVAPTDGVFFRYNAAAELRGVINYNGTETQTAAITPPSASVNHDFMIVVQTNNVVFYIDDICVGSIALLTAAPTLGQPMAMAAQPITIRTYHGASAPALATQFKVSDLFVTLLGPDVCRAWSEQKAGFGHMAYQGQNGGTMGTTALYANNSNPGTAVPTNTTAALGSGLGGKFQETLTLAAGTDGIISSFQNPAGSVTQTPRNLIIKGVTVSGVVTVALTTNPLAGTLALCFGHTAVSLATAESASFVSPTTKAARRIAIGTTSVASATAAAGTPVVGCGTYIAFTAPVVVAPGEFVAVSHNKVTTAPATGSIMWSITFDAYYE
jgi:hypothetical protein